MENAIRRLAFRRCEEIVARNIPDIIKYVSGNPNLPFEFVLANLDKDWNWFWISRNRGVTPNIVRRYPHLPWDWGGLSYNPNLTLEMILGNLDKNLDWSGISAHKIVTWKFIRAHPELPWDWSGISGNPNITWNIIKANPDEDWDWEAISENPNITWDIVRKNPDEEWDYDALSGNENINWDIVNENLRSSDPKPWNLVTVAGKNKTSLEVLRELAKKPMASWVISYNQNVTWEIIMANPDINWIWQGISMNVNMTWDIILANLDCDWSWMAVAENPGIIPIEQFRKQVVREYIRVFALSTWTIPEITYIIQGFM